MSVSPTPAGPPWVTVLIWAVMAAAIYSVRDVFLIAFLTFLLSYLVRAVVVTLARSFRPDEESPGLERWLTLGTFAGLVALLWMLAGLVGPQLATQSRLLIADVQRLEPQETLAHVLGRTVGAYLFSRTYGAPDDPRYQAAL